MKAKKGVLDYRFKLFTHKKPYDIENTSQYFVRAMRQAVSLHRKNSEWYRVFLDSSGFSPAEIRSEEDLEKIPPVPVLYFKRNHSFSLPDKEIAIKVTSSGTSGHKSIIAFDKRAFVYELKMALTFFKYYQGLSLKPAGYIMLGYSVKDGEGRGIAKTMSYATKFAPPVGVEYVLRKNEADGKMVVNEEGVLKVLKGYAKSNTPVRFVGLPPILYMMLKELEKRNITLKLNKDSKVMLGGGWKSFGIGEISHAEMTELLRKTLGIEPEQCFEIYSTVEHPIPYVKCSEGHFHTNIYTRPVIRDAETLKPAGYDKKGLLNLISPVMHGMPLNSVLTDDMAVLHRPGTCKCGLETSWFELFGRAGVSGVKTCSAEASELASRH